MEQTEAVRSAVRNHLLDPQVETATAKVAEALNNPDTDAQTRVACSAFLDAAMRVKARK